MVECDKEKADITLLNEEKLVPKLGTSEAEKRVESNLWYLDNGASNHMTGEKSKFRELDEKVTGQVKFGDGSVVHIRGKGSIMFQCKNGEERTLKEVYYIPMLRSNIISLGQLSECGNEVVMRGEFLWVRDRQGKLIMKVKRSSNRLYKIIIESNRPRCTLSSTIESSRLWHMRLGHVNAKAMSLMTKRDMVHGTWDAKTSPDERSLLGVFNGQADTKALSKSSEIQSNQEARAGTRRSMWSYKPSNARWKSVFSALSR